MIELLLQAERALSVGMVDQAERMYRQAAEADPRNSIAVVGLARVALERADDAEAWRQARRALGIDPENSAARRIVDRLEEVWRHAGMAPPDGAGASGSATSDASAATPSAPAGASASGPSPAPTALPDTPPSTPAAGPTPAAGRQRGIMDRLLGRRRT